MEKLLIFADVHQNIEVLLNFIKSGDFKNADKCIFLGDILFGTSNKGNECIEVLKNNKKCIFLMGNNDLYIAFGIPEEDYKILSAKKISRLEKIRKNIKRENIDWIKSLPKVYTYKDIYFCHYPWEKDMSNIVDEDEELTLEECEKNFLDINYKYIIFAHKHHHYHFTTKGKDFLCLASIVPELNQKTKGIGQYALITVNESGLQHIEIKNYCSN